ncbi:hypothetical protein PF010_g25136 [Phytophthora fragariae]|uniref:Uncharacterized protein n=1 Tax=Phytophthora fragariae TaxID=53985 RepID=A0A6A3HHD9_9STRA|nr:hypothetical protein PF011_g26990 [Phytophthora fragariae]KAE9073262.1 hypothetical protein PF010_g25136 [Phytophthora fragariae]KAE9183762.1 hypothetical protein PF002_g26620 [Phytophthora fragariae]KAE9279053.1 hypothetical protein PF001_g24886 [Phytophthora fragariae]
MLSLTASSALSTPSYYVTVGTRQDGTPFPLSKPIIREDGLLLVGTEAVADSSSQNREKNRIFVANFLTSSSTAQSVSHFEVEQEVRDIHWVDSQAAVVAIGKEIHIDSVYSDAIREIAVSPTTISHVVSGGFDETVVVTDLRDRGDPRAAAIIGKYDARDVVSGVRSPAGGFPSELDDGRGRLSSRRLSRSVASAPGSSANVSASTLILHFAGRVEADGRRRDLTLWQQAVAVGFQVEIQLPI